MVSATPLLRTPATAGRITGLTVGPFAAAVDSATASAGRVVLATNVGGPAPQTTVAVFRNGGATLVPENAFALTLSLNQGDGTMVDVFGGGASLLGADLDGNLCSDLVVAAGGAGMSNFRVIPGNLVSGGSQPAIDAALEAGRGQEFSAGTTGGRFFGSTLVNAEIKQVQQENLDFWYGYQAGQSMGYLGGGLNASFHVAAGDAEGRGRTQLFAALGTFNSTANSVVRFAFDSTASDVTRRWSRKETIQALGTGKSFALGLGVRLG